MYKKSSRKLHSILPKTPTLPVAVHQEEGKTLISNMCRLKATITTIYCYATIIDPEIGDSLPHLKKQIVKGCTESLTKSLGNYSFSGNYIYSLIKISSLVAKSSIIDEKTKTNYTLEVTFSKEISLKDIDTFTSEQIQEVEMIFNVYLRKILESLKLYPMKNNRYFNLSNSSVVPGTDLTAVTGYFLSISAIKEGIYLTIDTVREFFRQKSCLEQINEMKSKGMSPKQIVGYLKSKRITLFFGKGKTFRIITVDFDLNPITAKSKEGNFPLIKEFEEKYKVTVHYKTQPIIKASKKKDKVYLLPEFCYITGIEDETKKFGKGITELGLTSSEPIEKDKQISGLFSKLSEGHMLEQYGLIIENRDHIPLKLIPQPNLLLGPDKLLTPEALSKGEKIKVPIDFNKWIFVYETKNYDNAAKLYKTMKKSSALLGISIKEPRWLEVKKLDVEFLKGILSKWKLNHQFVLVLLSDHRTQYKHIKKLLDVSMGIISQCVFADKKKMGNLNCASTIIKQINAKLGGDLYGVEIPPEIPKNTMFVGIDVCHCGKNSIVGFYSNAYDTFARCYCDTIKQDHGQEVVSSLKPFYINALNVFKKQQGCYPEYIFIYRDGVARTQRQQILEMELSQLKEVFIQIDTNYKPEITLIIVNKRVHQRFLKQIGTSVDNPEPGTVIDMKETENGYENFFMVSAKAKKGTIRPTHYYIVYNERKEVTKLVIQKVTYAMCFMYYNATWALKIPAQIALADRKAYYTSIIASESHKMLNKTESFI